MQITLNFNMTQHTSEELVVIAAFTKTETKKEKILLQGGWPKEWKLAFANIKSAENFKGEANSQFFFNLENGTTVLALGMGEKNKHSLESLRKAMGNIYKSLKMTNKTVSIDLDSFLVKGNLEKSITAISESLTMSAYDFNTYKTHKVSATLSKITLDSKTKKTGLKKSQIALESAVIVGEAVNYARDLVNQPPNILNSESYAKMIEKDVKNIKKVKCKILGKTEIKKEKMGMFLSVNAGSAYGPRLVHLSYTPSKVTKNTKHIALVGKGLTFDTGGYSLKPAGSIINMKVDMAGSATVYGAFRALAKLGANVKISCFLGMTDNAINSEATMPDSVVTARNGKTVEILNTDAEGRLVLGDLLDYACDQKPDVIIDAATLTGAVLVSLGHEICGVMGNNQKLTDALLKAAQSTDEYMWQLPIIPEFRSDIKSPIADIKNLGSSRFGGSSKAAAFLENFIKNDIPWAHLDIAGTADAQGHLPYCPSKGASGLTVRTLVNYVQNA